MRWAKIRRRFFYFFGDGLSRKVFYNLTNGMHGFRGFFQPTRLGKWVSITDLGLWNPDTLETQTSRPHSLDSIGVGRSPISHTEKTWWPRTTYPSSKLPKKKKSLGSLLVWFSSSTSFTFRNHKMSAINSKVNNWNKFLRHEHADCIQMNY